MTISTCLQVKSEPLEAWNAQLDLRFAAAFGTLGTCGEWGWWRPDTHGVCLWAEICPPTPLLLPLWLLYEEATLRSPHQDTFNLGSCLLYLSKRFLSVRLIPAAFWRRAAWIWAHSSVGIIILKLIRKARLQHASVIPCQEVFLQQEAILQGEPTWESNRWVFLLLSCTNSNYIWQIQTRVWVNHSQPWTPHQVTFRCTTDTYGRWEWTFILHLVNWKIC